MLSSSLYLATVRLAIVTPYLRSSLTMSSSFSLLFVGSSAIIFLTRSLMAALEISGFSQLVPAVKKNLNGSSPFGVIMYLPFTAREIVVS